ncbi:small GTP-binding protein, putative [Trichomonas vaginalis G3]|uniref:Small GTP-binding protein, putative n=1 Tax=Trichomonas vaginalis (strain ATCC PRA-98 / G3) TaxID=412133 RepID=A2F4Z4_TRIV3|nr:retrograde vesicle-mediated transport, Golgi to ER [Trichomonas vaginalis G3]EAX99997.1 small GTP-binding protein, putative [Trichomonas vaginalis G3]KAI5523501.1 retrograde vesicle-mediated transport, Golgi to ER [Trichomonas vaginalis G3]|eukprot:XP_001312927.1 small GTP-binding protein [Trichomonas vaginalis G3]
MNVSPSKPEFKIVFVGDSSVGKTSIIVRYSNNLFSSDNQPTIGAAFVSKEVTSPYGQAILHIWDTAGQERYRSLVPMYSRGSSIAIIVFDTSDEDGFTSVEDWIAKVKEDVTPECKIIVVGNKLDLEPRFNREYVDDWSKKNDIPVVYASAKSGQGIDLIFQTVVSALPQAKFVLSGQDVDIENNKKEKKSCC